MLVVKRKTTQSIVINDNIVITVLACDNGSVKLGVDAPKDVAILRSELIEQVKKENEDALYVEEDLLKMLNLKNK